MYARFFLTRAEAEAAASAYRKNKRLDWEFSQSTFEAAGLGVVQPCQVCLAPERVLVIEISGRGEFARGQGPSQGQASSRAWFAFPGEGEAE